MINLFLLIQVTWISFNSTTTDNKQTLQQFGNGGTFFKLSIFGRDITQLSLYPEENELLLLPNSVFKVLTALSSREVSSGAPTRVLALFFARFCSLCPPRARRPHRRRS
jgi:NAD:arginine ADP-ribosyltransferase